MEGKNTQGKVSHKTLATIINDIYANTLTQGKPTITPGLISPTGLSQPTINTQKEYKELLQPFITYTGHGSKKILGFRYLKELYLQTLEDITNNNYSLLPPPGLEADRLQQSLKQTIKSYITNKHPQDIINTFATIASRYALALHLQPITTNNEDAFPLTTINNYLQQPLLRVVTKEQQEEIHALLTQAAIREQPYFPLITKLLDNLEQQLRKCVILSKEEQQLPEELATIPQQERLAAYDEIGNIITTHLPQIAIPTPTLEKTLAHATRYHVITHIINNLYQQSILPINNDYFPNLFATTQPREAITLTQQTLITPVIQAIHSKPQEPKNNMEREKEAMRMHGLIELYATTQYIINVLSTLTEELQEQRLTKQLANDYEGLEQAKINAIRWLSTHRPPEDITKHKKRATHKQIIPIGKTISHTPPPITKDTPS